MEKAGRVPQGFDVDVDVDVTQRRFTRHMGLLGRSYNANIEYL